MLEPTKVADYTVAHAVIGVGVLHTDSKLKMPAPWQLTNNIIITSSPDQPRLILSNLRNVVNIVHICWLSETLTTCNEVYSQQVRTVELYLFQKSAMSTQGPHCMSQ